MKPTMIFFTSQWLANGFHPCNYGITWYYYSLVNVYVTMEHHHAIHG